MYAASRTHVLLAPTTKAVEALKREIPEAKVQTVEGSCSLRKKTRSFKTPPIITVDEWGLLSNRSGHALLKIAKEHGALSVLWATPGSI